MMNSPKLNFKDVKDWIMSSFFSSKLNSVLTVFSSLLLIYVISSLFGFLSSAEWEVVRINRRLLLLGRLPLEDTWRAWPILWVVCIILFSSIGAWGAPSKWELLLMSLAFILPTLIFFTMPHIWHVVVTFLICSISYLISRYFIKKSSYLVKQKKF